jgi:hypothetical protein
MVKQKKAAKTMKATKTAKPTKVVKATKTGKARISVISPRGHLPPQQQIPMAPRLTSLKGKTVYIVDIRWPYTHQFLEEVHTVFSERYSDTRFILKEKAGSYGEDDPKLWAEIKKNGDAVIFGIGH